MDNLSILPTPVQTSNRRHALQPRRSNLKPTSSRSFFVLQPRHPWLPASAAASEIKRNTFLPSTLQPQHYHRLLVSNPVHAVSRAASHGVGYLRFRTAPPGSSTSLDADTTMIGESFSLPPATPLKTGTFQRSRRAPDDVTPRSKS